MDDPNLFENYDICGIIRGEIIEVKSKEKVRRFTFLVRGADAFLRARLRGGLSLNERKGILTTSQKYIEVEMESKMRCS